MYSTLSGNPLNIVKRHGYHIILITLVILMQSVAQAQTSAQSGNWNVGATWVGGVVPAAGNNVTIAAGHTVTLVANTDITTGNLTVTGTLALAGFNLTAGSLAGAGNIGTASGTPTVNVGGNNSSTSYSGVLSGTGTILTKSGSGTLTLTGTNTYTGATTISAGTLQIGDGGTTGRPGTANVEIQSGATFAVNRSNTITTANGELPTFSGAGIVVQRGTGTLGLRNHNSGLTGGVRVEQGTLDFGNTQQNLGTGTLTLGVNGGTGNVVLLPNDNNPASFTNPIVLASGHTGSITIEMIAEVNPPDGSVGLSKTLTGGITGTNNLTIKNSTLNEELIFTTGSINFTGTLTYEGRGLTTISSVIGSNVTNLTQSSSGKLILSGANTYSGATTISAGTLQMGASSVIPDGSALSVASGATFNLAGFSETVGSLAGAGTVSSTAAGTLTLTAGGNNTSTTFSGVIQNGTATSVALTKQGTGTLTLSGANTYTGITNINAGCVNIQNNSALGTSASGTVVTRGAKLQLQGGVTVTGETLTLNDAVSATGGTVTDINVSGINCRVHTFTSSGDLVVSSGGMIEYLMIGGGGGGARGGGTSGGGGGAGGYRSSVVGESSGGGASAEARITLTPQTYAVAVGAGGAAGTLGTGSPGGNSSFAGIVALGGGPGHTYQNAADGYGSGGGSSAGINNGGSGTAGQGYDGGGDASGDWAGSGGGGAGGNGGNTIGGSSSTVGGAGGSGVTSSINGTATARAGGGGGSSWSSTPGTATAGGGAGATGGATAANATANTGGGGGGAAANGTAGSGGSGIVIVRYTMSDDAPPAVENVSGNNTWAGTLTVNVNAIINLGTGANNLSFGNSSSVSWGTNTLTVNGWTGACGSGGTSGKIFFGTSTGTLTASQLAAVVFAGYSHGAQLLSTGELVPDNCDMYKGGNGRGDASVSLFNDLMTSADAPYRGGVDDGHAVFTVLGTPLTDPWDLLENNRVVTWDRFNAAVRAGVFTVTGTPPTGLKGVNRQSLTTYAVTKSQGGTQGLLASGIAKSDNVQLLIKGDFRSMRIGTAAGQTCPSTPASYNQLLWLDRDVLVVNSTKCYTDKTLTTVFTGNGTDWYNIQNSTSNARAVKINASGVVTEICSQ